MTIVYLCKTVKALDYVFNKHNMTKTISESQIEEGLLIFFEDGIFDGWCTNNCGGCYEDGSMCHFDKKIVVSFRKDKLSRILK